EKPRTVLDGSPFGVARAVIKPGNARERNRARAHRAGLERYIKIGAVKTPCAERRGTCAQGQHLSMCAWIGPCYDSVARAREDLALRDEDSAHRHLAKRGGGARLFKGDGHESQSLLRRSRVIFEDHNNNSA